MDIHVHIAAVHIHSHDSAKLDALSALVTQQHGAIMATIKELTTVVNAVAAEVPNLANGINQLEAAITALKAQVGVIPPDVQAGLDGAFATLSGALSGMQAAGADAADGVDEAATPAP